MLTPLRFYWRAARGHRLRPWRSPYLRWRVETYCGLEAERVRLRQFIAFCWRERHGLARFLRWTTEMNGYRRHGLRRHPGAGEGEQ